MEDTPKIKTLADTTTNEDTSWVESVERICKNVAKASPGQQLCIGGLSGWTVGYIGMKIGKAAAITLGCGLVFIQIASYKGYVQFNWKKVESNAKEMKRRIKKRIVGSTDNAPTSEQIKYFLKDHIYLAGGFAAGFFLGMGSG